ncbi:putative transcriptional regulator [Desulforapulum autotrophicum HRM2]|uniref:Transcriptional regulator n=1 Tax=Desulforapulum autotrophicum (strain ATCC 43914 / DSM 3382 / VKM B-1955 / HRM2) TaxID=177437 RepID=C0QIK4_DESAH|nr:ATP-binding protein [Desulforapulum autotrophicum]ACN17948.1 putative transcriptional regulator [Desulforapulum autotrophicum HRM2]
MNINKLELDEALKKGESLALEFKSDLKSLPDRDLIAAVVSLANTEGGNLLLGVEDDGAVTGLHPNHQNTAGLPALIANRTTPSLSVMVEAIEIGGVKIARIVVPKSRGLVSTSDGLLLRRRLKLDGTPEAVPFYPHEFIQRQSSMGLLDPSAAMVPELLAEDLNPLERHRLREAIRRYGGDQSLLPLADNELDGALGLSTLVDGVARPTVAGLLLLGKETDIRRLLPAHEVAFQVLHGTNVRVNEFFRKSLLQTFEDVEQLFKARVEEEEIQVGLFRVPIPNYDRRAFREAFVNALVHRDFARLGAVHVRIDEHGLSISSPGGFVEGVTLENLLVVAPRSRNPLLADIIKRVGLAERTGRGIDRIFEGMLRYGKPAPDYTMSDSFTVMVQMFNANADLDFLKMILEHEEKSGVMPIDSLIILARLCEERRLTTTDFVKATQKPEAAIRSIIEKLCEAGMVEAHGVGRGRTYMLSAKVYQQTGDKSAYVRQAGFDRIQQEQMVLKYIDVHGSIKRADVADLCKISPFQASRLLKKMSEAGTIQPKGRGKGTFYERR